MKGTRGQRLLAASVILVLVGATGQAWSKDCETMKVGDRSEQFMLKVLNKKASGLNMVSLDQYIGSDAKDPAKAVLISFFATYCEPCKKELPVLERLWKKYREKGLRVIVISSDKDGRKQSGGINELITKHGLTFPVCHDRFQVLSKRYMVCKLPYSLLITPDSKISHVGTGFTKEGTEELLANIQKALGVPATSASEFTEGAH